MKTAHIWVRDEVWMTVAGIEPAEVTFLWNKYGIEVEGSWFMPARKLGRWDGKIRFFEKTGKVFLRFIDEIVPFLEKWGYNIELHDERQPVRLVQGRLTETWFHGRTDPNVKLDMRPYQVEAVNKALDAQSGMVIAATGAGKCVHGETPLNIFCSDELKDLLCRARENGPQNGEMQ